MAMALASTLTGPKLHYIFAGLLFLYLCISLPSSGKANKQWFQALHSVHAGPMPLSGLRGQVNSRAGRDASLAAENAHLRAENQRLREFAMRVRAVYGDVDAAGGGADRLASSVAVSVRPVHDVAVDTQPSSIAETAVSEEFVVSSAMPPPHITPPSDKATPSHMHAVRDDAFLFPGAINQSAEGAPGEVPTLPPHQHVSLA